jgi:hypothetical protein
VAGQKSNRATGHKAATKPTSSRPEPRQRGKGRARAFDEGAGGKSAILRSLYLTSLIRREPLKVIAGHETRIAEGDACDDNTGDETAAALSGA